LSIYGIIEQNLFEELVIMPLVTIKMLEGRTLEQKRALVEKVTQAFHDVDGTAPENVMIHLQDMPRDTFARNGKLISEQ
jgi:4-oxalocrotonate tautomerase